MTKQATQRKRQFFVSLKWQAVILLSLVLLGVNMSFPLLNYYSLNHQFEQDRNEAHKRYTRELQGLIKQSALRTQQISELLPTLTNLGPLLQQNNKQKITEIISRYWPTLQLELSIDSLAFFNNKSQKLATWGDLTSFDQNNSLYKHIVQVSNSEHPAYVLDCDIPCTQYTIAPLLYDGTNVGTIVLGTSLADIVIGFHDITSTNLGIIVEDAGNTDKRDENGTLLPEWSAHIMALSNAPTTIPVLLNYAKHNQNIADGTRRSEISLSDKTYEIKLTPLDQLSQNGTVYMAIIVDITDPIAQISKAAQRSLTAGIIGLIASEAVLLFLLWSPMARLRNTAKTLPRLADSAFDEVRKAIAPPSRYSGIIDEIDLMDESAYNLSYQLEGLETQVRRHTKSLAEKIHELAKERDFIQGLLNTAQIVILTHDMDGKITLTNDYSQQLTGYDQHTLKNMFISDIIETDNQFNAFRNEVKFTTPPEPLQLHEENTLICKDGSRRDITWFHSFIGGNDHFGPMLLSVGLDITERKEAESQLTWLANHDPLTGLANRRRLQEELSSAVMLAKHKDQGGALLYIDLDQFKYINDTSGHHAGDYLLINVGNKLNESISDDAIVARLGGDEFAILIPKLGSEDVLSTAQKVHAGLNNIEYLANRRRHKITASIGIALFPEHGNEAKQILANADIAMFQAKEAGRSRSHIFSPQDTARRRLYEDVDWKQRIEDAFAHNRFFLVYQPILDIRKNTISHFEALLRMRDENDELLFPGIFIEVAERSGLIRAIDHFVVAQATKKLAELSIQGHDVSFSVNLSAHAFDDPDLLTLLKETLDNPNIKPSRLVFEITETAALGDIIAARDLMLAIKELGCLFALDDFGVGFSSFHYLKELPFDYIKIDGAFIQNLSNSKDDQILVRGLCQVGNEFGKRIIAEFVEDSKTLSLLEEYRIDLAQGFYIGKPTEFIEPLLNTTIIQTTPADTKKKNI